MIWARKKRGIQKNWELVIWNFGYLLIGTEWFGIYVFGTGDPHIAERGVYFRRDGCMFAQEIPFNDILCYPMLPYARDFLDSNLPVSGKESETRLLQFFYLQNFYETHGEPMVNQWWTCFSGSMDDPSSQFRRGAAADRAKSDYLWHFLRTGAGDSTDPEELGAR